MSHMHIYDKVCSDLPVVPETRCSGPFEVGVQHSLLRATKVFGAKLFSCRLTKSRSLLGKQQQHVITSRN